MSKSQDKSLIERIRLGINAIEEFSPWKKDFVETQTMTNAVKRDECKRLIRLLRAALGEECNEFSVFFPPN